MADLPYPSTHHRLFTSRGRGFSTSFTALAEYDAAADAWNVIATLPVHAFQ